jgi:hypothetical protein
MEVGLHPINWIVPNTGYFSVFAVGMEPALYVDMDINTAAAHAETGRLTARRAEGDRLYRASMHADALFSAALVAAYGHRAGDMRYRSTEHSPEIRTLGDAAFAAVEAWRAHWRTTTAGTVTASLAR